ncbi:ABC transporter substrate-binding protein [Vibrio sp. SCSIO 43136]|uniref:heme/hemin ABC transporter substrate-binding protein n=1 Tax=Vibrio sp. SCSIO 43136 TaxID=2819101 RepID=UPI0020754893|nr:ABC transporter substrate-binding protein [Vibrio sp. SCSIO 43136]USD66799.1 ABC transporter substrate-binding protein [Vibrio sp. SCSIO 43136]
MISPFSKFPKLCLVAIALFSSSSYAEQRIISAGSAVTEIIEELGASDKLVAIDVTSAQPEGKELPVVGYHRQLSAEGLLALTPSHLIGSDAMGPATTLTVLKNSGVEVDQVNSDSSVQGLYQRIDELSELTGTQSNAQALKAKVTQQVDDLNANQPKGTPLKALFLIIHEGRPSNVAGDKTTPNALIELAGAVNPAKAKLESYKPLSNESLIEMQPDVILVSGRSTLDNLSTLLDTLPVLAATPAGKNKRFISIDGKALVGGLGLKTLSEAQRLNKLLYPN